MACFVYCFKASGVIRFKCAALWPTCGCDGALATKEAEDVWLVWLSRMRGSCTKKYFLESANLN